MCLAQSPGGPQGDCTQVPTAIMAHQAVLPCLTSDSPPMHPGTPLRSTTCTRIISQALLLREPNLRPSFYRWAEEGRTDEGGRSGQTRRGVDETATSQARARGSQGREQHLLVCWAGMFPSGPR